MKKDVANIHATCIRLGAVGALFGASAKAGVLLLGPSGCGKSDLALRLMERGAVLVSDDRTELFVDGGKLFARAPASIAGLMEARGVGIVKLRHAPKTAVTLAVELGGKIPRLPQSSRYEPPLALPLRTRPPLIRLTAFEASTPAKIALAVAAFEHGLFREEWTPT